MNNWLLIQVPALGRSLGWALLHSLWQGLAIYAALRLLLLFIRKANANIKYSISVLALASLFTWFVYDWVTCYQQLQTITIQAGTVTQAAHVAAVNVMYPAGQYTNYMQTMLLRMEAYIPLLVTLYALGLAFMILRFSISLVQLRKLRNKGLVVPDAALSDMLADLKTTLSINKKINLFLSTRIHTPMLTGVLKPMILLPVATISQLSMEQLEAILLHELAHIKRHDYLLNVLQAVIETLLFFNPFVWWISNTIRREREHCCDDIVLANTPQALCYVQALAQLETYRQQTNISMTLAATGQKNQLFQRIKRIMEMKKENIHYGRVGIALMVTVALILSIAWFTPALAQKSKKKKNDDKEEVVQKKTIVKKAEKYVFIDSSGSRREYTSLADVPQADRERMKNHPGSATTTTTTTTTTATGVPAAIAIAGDDLGNAIANVVTVSMQKVGDAMNNIDWEKISADINKAQTDIESIDWAQMQKEIEEAMKKVNDRATKRKINVQVQKSIAKAQKEIDDIDWSQIQKEIAAAMKNIDNAKLSTEVNAEVQKALEKNRKEIAMSTVQIRRGKNGNAMAMVSSGENTVSSNSYEGMLDKMSAEGLINRNSGFEIEKRDGNLYIDGSKQPAEIYEKYNRYLNGKTVIVKGNKTNLNINVNQ